MSRLTPRERVRAALAHQSPDRVPFSWGFGPTGEMAAVLTTYLAAQGRDWARLRQATDDKRHLVPTWTGPIPPSGNTWLGIFGIQTKTQRYGHGAYDEFCGFPLAGVTDTAVLDRYPWPDARHYDYASLRATLLRDDPERHYAAHFTAGNPFEIYCWLTGLEEALCNVLAEPDLVRCALDHIVTFFEARLQRVLAAVGDQLDLIFLADDLGGQTGLLLSREAYRAVIQPAHRRLIACVRAHAPHARVFFHSDGAVFDILPDLLDAGIDMLEAVQTDAHGMEPERLKAAYGDRLAFHGGISVQQLLPHADAATVATECQRLVRVLGARGGYIAAPTHAIQIGTPPANVLAMLRAVLGTDDFAAAWSAARLA